MLPACATSPTSGCLARHSYQFFLAPVRTPETIAWVAMGFVADDVLAQKIRDLVGSQVAIVTHGSDGGGAGRRDAARRKSDPRPRALPAHCRRRADLPPHHAPGGYGLPELRAAPSTPAEDAVDLIPAEAPCRTCSLPIATCATPCWRSTASRWRFAAVVGAVLGAQAPPARSASWCAPRDASSKGNTKPR